MSYRRISHATTAKKGNLLGAQIHEIPRPAEPPNDADNTTERSQTKQILWHISCMFFHVMTWLVISLGMVFSTLVAWLVLHGPTRQFLWHLFCLYATTKRWVPWIIVMVILGGCCVWYHFAGAIGVQVITIVLIWIIDVWQVRVKHRDLCLVQQIVDALRASVVGGLDIYSACRRLEESQEPNIAQFGQTMAHCFSLGLKTPDSILLVPQWRKNQELNHFLRSLFDMINGGGHIHHWLTRNARYLHKKLQFRKTLSVKTTQIKMQFTILTLTSWFIWVVVLIIFPQAKLALLQEPICLQLIMLGLGVQTLGILCMKHMLRRTVEGSL